VLQLFQEKQRMLEQSFKEFLILKSLRNLRKVRNFLHLRKVRKDSNQSQKYPSHKAQGGDDYEIGVNSEKDGSRSSGESSDDSFDESSESEDEMSDN
jgi:hypothetical protein